jgi:hypothetical protein
MENGLKNVLERKGWIKDGPEMSDTVDYKVFHSEILPIGTVNRNNRIFSKEVVQEALKKLDGRPVPCRLNMPDPEQADIFELNHESTMGLAELSIKGDFLMADMRIRSDSELAKRICKGLDDGQLVPAPFGIAEATVPESGNDVQEITDYTLTGIGIIDKTRAVW